MNRTQKKVFKQQLIKDLLQKYAEPTPIKNSTHQYKPTDQDIKDYEKELNRLTIKQLEQTGKTYEIKPPKNLVDKIKFKFNKRRCFLVTILHKNDTIGDFVCINNSRFFVNNEFEYLRIPQAGRPNNKYGMIQYVYFENNPFPIIFDNANQEMGVVADAELMKVSMGFEFAQRMALMSKINTKIDITFFMSIIGVVVGFVNASLLIMICRHLQLF